ncbi:MAG: response regulator [bacterium]|nr:response regulator [bacterium]
MNVQQRPLITQHVILVVDDDQSQRSLLSSFLTGQGFQILPVASGEEALQVLSQREDIEMMISDVRMPGISGLDALEKVREIHPHLPVLMVTAYADIRDAVRAMRDGAVNYLEKPIDLDELLRSVLRAVGVEGASRASLPDDLRLPDDVVAQSPSMMEVFREAALVAASDSRILITGESGVGKEILSDVVHGWSPRREKPFIKVNCAAIPDALLESELFGHEKGSFTGASQQRIGRFEEAADGTILLDEIAEMSPTLQAKLLRVTQDGTFQRVGSNKERNTNARILAATNRNLEEEVEKGAFREDLFFRLNVMEIFIPPLRDRREDILPLATRFAAEFTQSKPRFSNSVSHCLEQYEWPGNVRELRNAIERATLISRGDVIIPEHLPKRLQSFLSGASESEGRENKTRLEDIERDAIFEALKKHNNNRTQTARELGISRRALLYKLQKYIEQGYPVE